MQEVGLLTVVQLKFPDNGAMPEDGLALSEQVGVPAWQKALGYLPVHPEQVKFVAPTLTLLKTVAPSRNWNL